MAAALTGLSLMTPFPAQFVLPPRAAVAGEVALPGSKSLSIRTLLLAALARGETRVVGLLDSDDTRVMLDALARLGVRIVRERSPAGEVVVVQGCDGVFPVATADLFVGNSGLSIRTLVPAIVASLAGHADPAAAVTLDGVARMRERPIGDLVDGLAALGAKVEYQQSEGFPPLRLRPAALQSSDLRVRGQTSSQFLTGLLQAAPQILAAAGARHDLQIALEGELISKPYVTMTIGLMARFGVRVEQTGWERFSVPSGQAYTSPGSIAVEGDASSASYFLAAGAIAGGPVRVRGVGRDSVQGDVGFAHALSQMGAQIRWGADWIEAQAPASGEPLQGIELDCVAIPDAAMTLAACALHARGETHLYGIGSWRVKETDRIAAMATELRKLGAEVHEGPDWIRIVPPERLRDATVDTYDDHRMAMCLSLASLSSRVRAGVTVTVRDPACVAKTFPEFFKCFASLQTPAEAPVLTLDGPTASGKGTIAAAIARELGWHLLDSGALYRLTALAARQAGVAWSDEPALATLAAQLPVRFEQGGTVLLNNQDVTLTIREEAIGEGASQVAVWPAVRAALLERQRAFRQWPGLVADGRDMGTVVFPDAPCKIFLQASAEERARRRFKQLIEKGFSANFDDLLQELNARDARDAMRAVAPTVPAPDAWVLDTTGLSVEETVATVQSVLQQARP